MRCLLSALILLFLGNVSVAQNADFSADVISGCFPLTVNFTDLSTGSGLNSWAWSFGNGNTSGLQNPGTVYANPGVYTVRLTVSNASQSDTETKASYIVVYGNPTVDFIYDKSSGCKPLTVRFTDQTSTASGAISSWFWVFGDGGSSTDQNPTHTFTAAGSKTVILKVQNEHGCEFTKIINSPIEVFGPVTDFSASNTTVCTVPSPINFTNLTTGDAPLSYQWNYGDGATSTGTNGSHIYTSTGAFTVSLTSRDVRGCEDSHSMVINTGNAGGLSFQPSATKVCIGQPISFTVFPNAPVLSSDWDFGNGITSTDPSPEIQFSAVGNYTITLTAMLGGNACASVFSKTIEVAEVAEPTFTFSTDCDFNTIFTGSNNRAFRVEWYILGALVSTAADFVYPFHSPGAATVTLIAYNNLGCNNQVERTITVVSKPTASFLPDLEQDCRIASLSGCAPFTLVLKNTSSSPTAFTSHWDFGDGGASSQQDPVHTYQAKGTYTLTLTVTNAAGCIDITTATVTVADVKPTASFTRDKTTVCAKEIVNFTDQSLNANFWCWDFGDGTFGTGKTIAHGYSRPGTYTVKLTAKNAGCTDSFQIVNAVQVKDPYVDFAIQKNCPDPYRIDLVNLSTNYNSLRWDFGDGTVVNSDVPSHRYAATGSYDIKLSGTNTATACTVDAELTVQIQDIKADFTTNNPTPCKGSPVGFTDQSLFASQWLWDFGNGLSSSAKDPVTKYTSAGSFGIKLTVADSDGCTDDLTLPVTVLDIEGNFDFTASSTCTDLTVKFSDRSLATPSITSWSWDFGDGNSSTLQNPTNVYHTIKNYPVSLTVTGPQGTCAYIRDNAVKFTNPAPDFLIFKPEYCIDENVFIANRSANAQSYKWDLDIGKRSQDVHAFTSYPSTGKYSVTLSATDKYGCEKSATKNEYISIVKPAAIFTAQQTAGDCPPFTAVFQDKSVGSVKQWLWDFGDGKNSTLKNPANTYLKTGNFDIKLKVTDANGCVDVSTAPQFIRVGGPTGTYSGELKGEPCTNQAASFTASSTNATIHRWDFGDGVVVDKEIKQAEHIYTKAGTYSTALLLIDSKGCKAVADGSFKVTIKDTTKFSMSPSPDCIFEGDSFQLEASVDNEEMTWEWIINDQVIGTDSIISSSLDSAGDHTVLLRGINTQGCPSAIAQKVKVHGNLKFIPNVFTPNGDSYNSHFKINDLVESKWNIQIYNRWGDAVYKKDDYANDWTGGGLPEGVYYYNLINLFCPERKYKGNVLLLR